jgi:xylan 1,4-beta-xylosidase
MKGIVAFAMVTMCLLAAPAVGQETGKHAAEYENPIIRGVNPDPSIIRVGEDYYLVNSSFSFYPGCPIHHSRDLVNWELIGYALTRPSQFSLDKNHGRPQLYAATLRYHDGTFYVITTDVNGGGNFYVTAKNPAGPWSDPIYIDKPQFDPSLFFDDDGTVYYTRRGPFETKDIVQATIDIKTGKLLTALRSIGVGMVSDDAEGPHLYHINGWYYLSEAEGGSRFLHMQTIGRSKSPWGPFEPSPHNPWVSQHTAWWFPVKSTGHADLVDTPDGHWWAVYLATRHANYGHFSIGRETFLAPVEWKDDWPVVKPQDMSQLTVHEQTLPLHPWPVAPARDDFSSTTLALPWNFLDYPQPGLFSLTERPGFLRLHGQSAGLEYSPGAAFVARRQTEWNGADATRMEFEPVADNDEAGLAVFMSPDFHYEIYKTRVGGKLTVALRKCVGDIKVVTATAEVGPGALQFKIEYDPEHYRFYYAEENGVWKLTGSGLERLISSEVAVWSGTMIGLYSTGNGHAVANPADFDWFEDRPVHVQYKSEF